MPQFDLLTLVIVAAAAFYGGYHYGRSSMARADTPAEEDRDPPVAESSLPGPTASERRPRGAPPPASAGPSEYEGSGDAPAPTRRRSSAPPPAAAGLMQNAKPDKSSKK